MSNHHCACGRVVYSETDKIGDPLYRFQRDDYSPACDRCQVPNEAVDIHSFAEMVQAEAESDAARPDFNWAIGGSDGIPHIEVEFAIEPDRGGDARDITDELYGAVESLPDFRDGARIVTRSVTYGPWRYVTAAEVRA